MPHHISLPSPTTPPTRSASYRSPLTPSTVTPPSVSTHNSSVTKNDLGTSPTKATSLLGKFASSPSPRRAMPVTPLLLSPSTEERPPLDRRHTTPNLSEEKRGWTNFQKQDGYISFPDFEYYYPSRENEEDAVNHHERHTVNT